jgi:sugar phosphate permease
LKSLGFSEAVVGQTGFFSTIAGAVFSIPSSCLIDRYCNSQEPLTFILLACTVLYTAVVLMMRVEPSCLVMLIFICAVLGLVQATAMPALELSYPHGPLILALAW